MSKPATIAALVLILVTIFYFLARRTADGSDDPNNRSGNRANAMHAEKPLSSSAEGPPSKSGSRTARPEHKIITTNSGLKYEVLVEGSGPRPGPTDMVKVHYHGTTLDGTVFDSSVDRGKPTSFPLNRVIKGWTEGVQLMQVGAKYRFTIPPDLAYGKRGAGDKIGPDEILVFEIELLELPPKR
jgi:FKBP-type peptidyl-prolyl cis-trans isomerase